MLEDEISMSRILFIAIMFFSHLSGRMLGFDSGWSKRNEQLKQSEEPVIKQEGVRKFGGDYE